MAKHTRTVKIEVTKFPSIKIDNPLKVSIDVKKLEGVLEVKGNLLTNPIIKKIIDSLSKESIELKISEIEKTNKETSNA